MTRKVCFHVNSNDSGEVRDRATNDLLFTFLDTLTGYELFSHYQGVDLSVGEFITLWDMQVWIESNDS